MDLKAVLEGLLFVSGADGISNKQIIDILDIDETVLNDLIEKLKNEYDGTGRGFNLEYLGGKWKMTTKKEYAPYYKKLFNSDESNSLSSPALETLAIIAYNQPVTRMIVDEIRGVNSAHLVRKLLFMNFIKEVGRSELPGKPILYAVTDDFLDYFGLSSIQDLPKIEVDQEDKETDLFSSIYKEN